MIAYFIGKVSVTSPGTPVQVTSDLSIRCAKILFAVDTANTGKTYLGGAGMSKTTRAGVGRAFTQPPASGPQDGLLISERPGEGNSLRPADYWIDADNANDGLLVTYWIG